MAYNQLNGINVPVSESLAFKFHPETKNTNKNSLLMVSG